jgi:hypothetical protein
MGLVGTPLAPELEASASAAADVYADILVAHYARRIAAVAPGALRDDLTVSGGG